MSVVLEDAQKIIKTYRSRMQTEKDFRDQFLKLRRCDWFAVYDNYSS